MLPHRLTDRRAHHLTRDTRRDTLQRVAHHFPLQRPVADPGLQQQGKRRYLRVKTHDHGVFPYDQHQRLAHTRASAATL